jgi:glycosyltransferase involved in cell wall biosynthesis
VYAGAGAGAAPFLTIAIPTYRRADLLAEAVRSALAQQLDRPIEVVVVDDDPQSTGHARLLEDVPEIAAANFRYLRNRGNLGDFGNHSRCVASARGKWLTILHDDDLLDRSFAREMFAQLGADPRIDGLVCRKRLMDRRRTPVSEGALRGLGRGASVLSAFGLGNTRAIPPGKLFWACIPGNTVGFVCRTADAIGLGGFYPEDYPSADYYFYVRFAQRFRLRQSRKVLASIRLAENVSMRVETQLAAFARAYELQSALAAAGMVPNSRLRISPLLIARQLAVNSWLWQTRISREEVGNQIGVEVPKDRPLLLYAQRTLFRGF